MTGLKLTNQLLQTIKIKREGKKGTSMILCFYWQEPETFKENHKIIDVPLSSTKIYDRLLMTYWRQAT